MKEGEFISKVPNTVQQVITDDVTTATNYLSKDIDKDASQLCCFTGLQCLKGKKSSKTLLVPDILTKA